MSHKSFLTILKGKYKNRKIPVPAKIHGHNNVTPQKIKEAVFQIIENNLENGLGNDAIFINTIFIDLFSGSGQMGLEAVSRGFDHVFFYDISKDRTRNLGAWVRQHIPEASAHCTFEVKDGTREYYKLLTGSGGVIEYLEKNPHIKNVVIFADPPYGLNSKNKYLLDYLLDYKTLNPARQTGYEMLLILQTCNTDLYRCTHKEIEHFPETRKPAYVKGYYEYGRHRIVVV